MLWRVTGGQGAGSGLAEVGERYGPSEILTKCFVRLTYVLTQAMVPPCWTAMLRSTPQWSEPTQRRQVGDRRYRVLLVSSSGGVLLDLLALEPWWSRHDTSWLAVRAADTEAALAGRQVRWAAEQSARRPLGVLAAALRAGRLLRRERPDVIVSAGSGVAVGVFLAARVLRVPALWLETLNLVGAPGLASRVCTRLAAAVLVQRPSLAPSRPRAVVLGELY
jgi:Oligosaccharide biosynthesis protein Alg14 like